MSEESKVEISIEASKSTGAVTAAAAEFDDLKGKMGGAGEAAKKTSDDLASLDKVSEELTKKLTDLASAAAIGAFFKQAVDESLKEAEALRVLKGSVESMGASWERYKDQIEAFAAAQQAATRFDDTVTFEVLGKLARATNSVGEAMRATRLAQDLSVAAGKPLAQTTDIINQLLLGQERAVKMATKELGNYAGGATTAQGVLDNLEKSVTGAAAAEQSHAKALAQGRAEMADFQQKIGDGLVPAIVAVEKVLLMVVRGWNMLGETIAGVLAAATVGVTGIFGPGGAVEQMLVGNFKLAATTAAQTKDQVIGIAEETAAAIAAINGEKVSAAGSVEEEKLKARESLEVAEKAAADKLELQKKLTDEIIQGTETEFDFKRIKLEEELAAAEKLGVDKATIEANRSIKIAEIGKQETAAKAKELKAQALLDEQKKKDFASTLQFISTLSTAKNKELAMIGKVAGIANAYINTGVAVTRALAAAPPPFNFVLAAAVGAAGAAQIATIAGVQLRKGALVKGSQEGTAANIAEDNRDEAVIPLEDSRAMARIGGAIAEASGGSGGSGGGTTIINLNVNATLDWRTMANALAEEAENGSPEIIRLSTRLSRLADKYEGRAS